MKLSFANLFVNHEVRGVATGVGVSCPLKSCVPNFLSTVYLTVLTSSQAATRNFATFIKSTSRYMRRKINVRVANDVPEA